MLAHVIIGAVAFVSTNVDDIVVLALFFAQRGHRASSIVLGQFLGMAALVFVSAVAALAAVAFPGRWLALLGIAPLAIGIRQLVAQPAADDDGTVRTMSGVWTVASVTIANGGDNIGVYIPLFAAHTSAIPIYVAVFALGTALWCAVGAAVVRQPQIGRALERYGHRLVPWVLIGIGLYVLSGWWKG